MNERSLRVLEWPKIKEALASYASFSLGRELVQRCEISTFLPEIRDNLQLTSAALELLWQAGQPPFGGAKDIRAIIKRAEISGVLDGSQLLETAGVCYCGRNMREYIADCKGLQDYLGGLFPLPDLVKEINRCLDDDGLVRDNASSQLASVRQKMRTLANRVRDKLESIVHSSKNQKMLQEAIVTIRGGRYVVPVKSEYKAHFAGIVHDQSGSGATLFIEPAAVVDLNNQLRLAEQDEQKEVQRILQQLSRLVQQDSVELTETLDTLAQLDFIFARARYSKDIRGVEPAVNDECRVDIKQGRHPLLKGEVVPIDLWLGDAFRLLVITGPNTGGKTVTLKTLGLLCLMSQAGLHVPAEEGTELGVFEGIFADIGDEQSIEQSLSTFSSHMTNIVDIMECANEKTLVLLDELGAGTDPVEGAALATALLEYLRQRRVTTVATTHYSELKHFAYSNSDVENASVDFDEKTLQPTYTLAIGIPGRSNAFAIARRLGLQEEVLETAQGLLSDERVYVEDLLGEIEGNRRQARRDRDEAERERQEYEALKAKYDKQLASMQEQRETMLAEARTEAQEVIAEARRDMDLLIGELRKRHDTDFEDIVKASREQLLQRQQKLRSHSKEAGQQTAAPHNLKPGEEVRIRSLNQLGHVLEPGNNDEFLVQAGIMKITVKASDLERTKSTQSGGRQKYSHSKAVGTAKTASIHPELDLRGTTVEEAVALVDKYLDDAFLSSLGSVRLIHGKGTGALRAAIQEQLKMHPHVKSFRLGDSSEGGSGVTSVQLANVNS